MEIIFGVPASGSSKRQYIYLNSLVLTCHVLFPYTVISLLQATLFFFSFFIFLTSSQQRYQREQWEIIGYNLFSTLYLGLSMVVQNCSGRCFQVICVNVSSRTNASHHNRGGRLFLGRMSPWYRIQKCQLAQQRSNLTHLNPQGKINGLELTIGRCE